MINVVRSCGLYVGAAVLVTVAACSGEPEQLPPPAPEIVRAPTQAISQMALQDMAACADDSAPLLNDLGNFSRSVNTGLEIAQAYFDQGMRLTYGYHFPEAIASFDAALCYEPGNALIHWGRALAIGPNPDSRQAQVPDDPAGAGRNAINRAVALRETMGASERGLIDTLAVLYSTETWLDPVVRTHAYVEAAEENYHAHPDDAEAAFLLAQGLLMIASGSSAQGDSVPGSAPVIARAREVLDEGVMRNPRHPGLKHLHTRMLASFREPESTWQSAKNLEPLIAPETLEQAWGNRRLPRNATWDRSASALDGQNSEPGRPGPAS